MTLDCAKRRVIVGDPMKECLVHECETLGDSIMTSFLYSLEIPQRRLEDVEIVCEYLDVFEEAEGLLPRRVVEFRIDLVPGAGPIAKSAYRMAPKEVEEMKRQLDKE